VLFLLLLLAALLLLVADLPLLYSLTSSMLLLLQLLEAPPSWSAYVLLHLSPDNCYSLLREGGVDGNSRDSSPTDRDVRAAPLKELLQRTAPMWAGQQKMVVEMRERLRVPGVWLEEAQVGCVSAEVWSELCLLQGDMVVPRENWVRRYRSNC
jgi:hypothetical protein